MALVLFFCSVIVMDRFQRICNWFSWLYFCAVFVICNVVCCQDQHMKHSLRSCTRLLRTTNASASQSCHSLTLQFLIMQEMYAPLPHFLFIVFFYGLLHSEIMYIHILPYKIWFSTCSSKIQFFYNKHTFLSFRVTRFI